MKKAYYYYQQLNQPKTEEVGDDLKEGFEELGDKLNDLFS